MHTDVQKACFLLRVMLSRQCKTVFPALDDGLREKHDAGSVKGKDIHAWALRVVKKDKHNENKHSFEALQHLKNALPASQRLHCVEKMWYECIEKGYLTVEEGLLLLKTAHMWEVEKMFLASIDK